MDDARLVAMVQSGHYFASDWLGLAISAVVRPRLRYRCGGIGGLPVPVPVVLMTRIATPIMEATSAALAGMTSVLLAFASSPNCVMYCSATRSCTAWAPP